MVDSEIMVTKNLSPLKISIVIPNYNGSETLKRCLEAVRSSYYQGYECIVVDDASTDNTVEMVKSFADHIIQVKGGPLGPANARNLGARAARGDIIFFIDADVVIYPDTLGKVADSFNQSSELAAVFGSYDDQPGDVYFLSQYKNLFHHFVHQQANENSRSFWSGCGAIRREIFLELGGFDTVKYPHPSIEDIELGHRLISRGYKILINKTIQVKHLKRWTLLGLIKTDIFDRGIPWTQLVMADRKIPNDLNLESTQRLSALIIGLLLMFVSASALFYHQVLLLPILLSLFWIMLQCWQWREQLDRFEVSRLSLLIIGVLATIFVGLILWLKLSNYLYPMIVLLVIAITGPWLTLRSQLWRNVVFSLMMIAILTIILQVIVSCPLWLTALLFFLLGIFIFFNREFYAFFRRKRGMMFAVAVIPLHMLYFLYSMVAFALGVLIYYKKTGLPFLPNK